MASETRSIQGCSTAVIGAAGFLGSHLTKHLIRDRKCHVLAIDNLCAGKKEFLHQDAEFVHADVTVSESYLRRLFEGWKVEYVFNYAANPYVPDSFERPGHVFNTNAVGAMNVLNAAHEAGVKGILQVSSAEIYGEPFTGVGYGEWTKLNENTKVAPHSSYGASKAAIDFYVQARWREARVPCIALRQFNCVGERETHPYVIPEIISQLFRAKQKNGGLTIRLGNNSTRDFLYAGDQAVMATELLEKGEFGEVYNLGSESGVKIYELAQMLSDVVGAGRIHIEVDSQRVRPWEIWFLASDNAKVYSVIESRPKVSLKEALGRTVEDFIKNGKKWCWEK
jgi:nucleoside-diphosphate-sugar epimerase